MPREPTISRPPDLLAGFIAVLPDPSLPELVMAGEQWGYGGQYIGEHRHEVWEFYHQVSGESQWRVSGRICRLGPGSLLAVPPGISHRMAKPQSEEHHYYFAAIDPAAVRRRCPELPDVFRNRRAWTNDTARAVAPSFAAVVREVSLFKPARALGLRLAVDSLMLEIARTKAAILSPPAHALAWHPGVERAVGMIRQNPGGSLNVRSLARLAALSPGHLTELFKTHVGCTPHRFLLKTRLERALELIEASNLPLTQVALELGFASSQHLSSAFNDAFGCPPREWRSKRHSQFCTPDRLK